MHMNGQMNVRTTLWTKMNVTNLALMYTLPHDHWCRMQTLLLEYAQNSAPQSTQKSLTHDISENGKTFEHIKVCAVLIAWCIE